MEFLFGLIIGSIGTYILDLLLQSIAFLRERFWDNHTSFFGYHVHHTVFGLMLIVLGIFLFASNISYGLFLMGIGIGIIVVHTHTDKRLVFVEKSK